MARAVSKLPESPFLRKRSTLEPPLTLFQRITKGSPAVRVWRDTGEVKAFRAKALAAEVRVKTRVESCIVKLLNESVEFLIERTKREGE
jgi:hypothetical protein